MSAVYEFDHWVDNLRHIDAYGEERASGVSPFAKIQAISSVYFPQFDKAISEFDSATSGYRVWMTQAGQKRIANKLESMNEGFLEAYKGYAAKRDALLNELKEFAHGEFQ